MLRTAIVGLLLMGGGYYLYHSMFEYSRVVERTPDQVAMGLSDLDITEQPGSPGTDPSRSGGIRPVITHQRTPEGVVWKVMSGKDVALTMTAHLTPVDGGKHTKVTASVERGNAPDDFVSPAFRSKGTALGLFAMAIEDELNDLVEPVTGDFAACKELYQRFEASNFASADLQRRDNLKDAVGDVSKTVIRLNAFEAEARRLGCNKQRASGFDEMVGADEENSDHAGADESEDGGWGNR